MDAISTKDAMKRAEESLREAACFGDEEAVKILIESGVNVNVQHSVNGWTPLHWATKRGHIAVVRHLLACGANPNLKSFKGEIPLELAPTDEIRELISSGNTEKFSKLSSPSPLPITPNYISHPPIAPKINLQDCQTQRGMETRSVNHEQRTTSNDFEELVVKVRTSNPPHQDFIEVEIPHGELTFANLLKICCEELEVNIQKVLKLRKLPNTMLRKDKDVLRLKNFTELEIVLQPDCYSHFTITGNSTSEINGFIKNVSAVNKNRSESSPNLFEKSNFCKNGRILY